MNDRKNVSVGQIVLRVDLLGVLHDGDGLHVVAASYLRHHGLEVQREPNIEL